MAKRPGANPSRSAAAIGARVMLRHPVERDRDAYIALRRESRAFLERWEPLPPSGVEWNSEEAFDRFLTTSNSEISQRFLVCARTPDQIMGQLSLGGIMRGSLQQCFMGYWIGAPFAGKGFMTEAVKLAQRLAFRELRLHRIEVNMQPINEPSKRLAKACGFRYEGYSPRYLEIDGVWVDHERWAMTVEDYEALAWAKG